MRNAHRKNWWHHLSKSIPINVGENRFLWEKFEVRRNQTGLARVIGVGWNRKIKRKVITKSLIQHHKTLFGQSLWCTFSANARKHCIIYDKISPICKLQYEKNSTKTLAYNIWMKFLGKLKVQSASDELWCSVKFKYGLFVFLFGAQDRDSENTTVFEFKLYYQHTTEIHHINSFRMSIFNFV